MACGHEAVSSIVARADEDEDARVARVREFIAYGACDGEAGVLHEPVQGDARCDAGGLDAAHLVGGDDLHGGALGSQAGVCASMTTEAMA